MIIDFQNFNLSDLKPENSFEKEIVQFLEIWFLKQKSLSVQTSGSTGIPKIIEVEKNRMLNSAKMTVDFLRLQEGNTALLCLPVQYISGMMMLVRAITKKLLLTVVEPKVRLKVNPHAKFAFAALTPLQVQNNLDLIPNIKKLIIGGAKTDDTLKDKIRFQLQKKPENEVYETYGMSETLSHIALRQIFPKDDEFFTAMHGVAISIDDRGCLVIKADHLSEEAIVTNDLVEIFAPSQFRFLGRADNIINSGGAKINPEELESLTKKFVNRELIYIGLPNKILGEEVVLVVEGTESSDIVRRISQVQFRQKYHTPKEIFFLAELPRTENGKISRPLLKQKLLNDQSKR